MYFESLSYRYNLNINAFPHRWLPLIFLYDPDLPLFPIGYFHVLADGWTPENRPGYADRAFGYIERVELFQGNLKVQIVCNKDLQHSSNQKFVSVVEHAVHSRLGISDPVTISDIANAFSGPHHHLNSVLIEIWHRVVATAYGDCLPFGRMWDPVLGLSRFVASWWSPGGRKGEMIQTHSFVMSFGEAIQSAGEIPQTDFHLLPTYEELVDLSNPLNLFPHFQSLCDVAAHFNSNHCTSVSAAGMNLSAFNRTLDGNFDTAELLGIIDTFPHKMKHAATDCYNAFNKGPTRTVIYLMMLSDLRSNKLMPANLTPLQCAALYKHLKGTYQSPKTIQIYAQQCHGNPVAVPIDTWVETFLKWPLALCNSKKKSGIDVLFSNSNNLGKVERLIWVASQARKVHSSACNDALWCMKYGSLGGEEPRGANPLACNICLQSIRQRCPAYAAISNRRVVFNAAVSTPNDFMIETSQGNNIKSNQTFVRCAGYSLFQDALDEFSPVDESTGFASYPQSGHSGVPITVAQFVSQY